MDTIFILITNGPELCLEMQHQDEELSADEQQQITDLEALMRHFDKLGFCYSTEKGGNDIHSEQSKNFLGLFSHRTPTLWKPWREGTGFKFQKI